MHVSQRGPRCPFETLQQGLDDARRDVRASQQTVVDTNKPKAYEVEEQTSSKLCTASSGVQLMGLLKYGTQYYPNNGESNGKEKMENDMETGMI